MTKQTVCFVHGDALDLFRGENGPRFGGSETQVYLLAKLLADKGEFGVRVVADKDVTGASYPGVTFREAVPAVQRGVPVLSRFVNRARERRPYEDLGEVVLFQTILCDYTLNTWRTARNLGFKFVYRMSCDADIDGSFFAPEKARLLHAAIQDADGVIAQNAVQQERLRTELGIESTVVPTVVDVPDDGPSIGGRYVLWAGRGAPIKRPWIMIEVARRLPAIEFVMLMPVEEPLFWRCVVQEAERVPNLTVIPGVSYFDMPAYYRGAAIFANTSAIEGVPSVFLQSAAQGTPVVSLEVDPGRMLESGGFGMCANGDVDAFRSAIEEYMARPELVREQGLAAYAQVKQYNSPAAVEPILSAFLRRVFSG